jgi:hypothetical protein
MPAPISQHSTALPPAAPAVIWGDFTITEDDVAELRSALRDDCPETPKCTDDEVRQMAYDTIHFIALIVEFKQQQRAA